MIIGISGYARAGKDEIAKILVEEFDFKRVSYADKLREVLYQLNPVVAPAPENYFGNPKIPVRLQNVIDVNGWDGYKETRFGPEIRRLLQRLGTEAGRNTLWDSIWVDAAFMNYKEGDNIVIPDTRFPNEYDAIKTRGGRVWRVNREGVGPTNSHISETGIDDYHFDVVINNNWSLEDLRNAVRNTMYEYSKAF